MPVNEKNLTLTKLSQTTGETKIFKPSIGRRLWLLFWTIFSGSIALGIGFRGLIAYRLDENHAGQTSLTGLLFLTVMMTLVFCLHLYKQAILYIAVGPNGIEHCSIFRKTVRQYVDIKHISYFRPSLTFPLNFGSFGINFSPGFMFVTNIEFSTEQMNEMLALIRAYTAAQSSADSLK